MENREILFRGIRKDSREWVEGVPVESNMNGEGYETFMYVDYTVPNAISLIVGKGHFGRCVEVIPETVEQFTGRTSVLLCEDNVIRRIRIYGGDRVETENGIGTVFYDEAETSYVVLYDDGNSEVLGLISGTLEIIGTIHDHLLGDDNE